MTHLPLQLSRIPKSLFLGREWLLAQANAARFPGMAGFGAAGGLGLRGGRSLRVLFSESEWEPDILRYAGRTSHRLEFGRLSSARLSDYDAVVPLNIEDVYYLADRPELTAGHVLRHPSRTVAELCNDKRLTHRFLFQAGMTSVSPAADVRSGMDVLGSQLPLFVKPRVGKFGEGCRVIRTETELREVWPSMVAEETVVQRLIEGNSEYAVHLLFQGGRVISHLGVKYEFDHPTPIKGIDRPRCTWLFKCPHLPVWASLLGRMGYQGICCVNYKLQEGKPMLLEINPRFGGSLALYFIAFLRRLGTLAASPRLHSVQG